MEVTIVQPRLYPFTYRMSNILKKNGIKLNCISYYKQYIDRNSSHLFKRRIFLFNKNKNILWNLLHIPIFLIELSKIKKNVLIGITSTTCFFVNIVFLFMRWKALKLIYFPYDIAFFRYKNNKKYPWYVRWSEKTLFKKCDKIIHKGPKDELKYLPRNFKVLDKPSLQFLPYCEEETMIPIDNKFFERKLSKKDGKIHLVYVGGLYYNHKFHYDTFEIFEKICRQKCVLHVYAHPIQQYNNLKKDKRYVSLQKTGKFFLHKPIYGKKFQREISKYDWGVYIFEHNFEIFKRIWANTAFGNKVSTYLESGLPIICNSELKFVKDTIEANNFGISINNFNEISKKIREADYKKILEKIKNEREKFTLKRNINNFIQFIN